jgi:hypothetical protein
MPVVSPDVVVTVGGSAVDWLSFSVTLSIDADNGTATVTLYPATGSMGDDLIITADGGTIFNGIVSGDGRDEYGNAVLTGKDVMSRMQHNYAGDDREYTSDLPASAADDWDQEIVQNLLEAMGVPASLTSIEGASKPIGLVRPLRLKTGDHFMDVIRDLDRQMVPNFVTFSRGNGAVYRRARTTGTSVYTFDETDVLSCSYTSDIDTIRNGCKVTGYPTDALPVEAEAIAANALVPDPPGYFTETIDNAYFIETTADAQELADWIVGEKNGVLYTARWRTVVNAAECLGATVLVNYGPVGFSDQAVYVTGITHSGDSSGAWSDFQGEWRS